MTFKVIVISQDRSRTSLVLTLPGAPIVGDEISLPNGDTTVVRHVTSGTSENLDGVIIAGTGP